jgi:hypothetical protein
LLKTIEAGQISQVNTLPKARSQAKEKRVKDRQKDAALRCKVGVAPPGFEVRRRMSRVAFRKTTHTDTRQTFEISVTETPDKILLG